MFNAKDSPIDERSGSSELMEIKSQERGCNLHVCLAAASVHLVQGLLAWYRSKDMRKHTATIIFLFRLSCSISSW